MLQIGERSTCLIFSCFTHDHENFEMCGVFHANHGLWESRFRVIKLGCYVIVNIGCKYVTFSLNVRIRFKKYIIIAPYIVSLRSRKDSEANDIS